MIFLTPPPFFFLQKHMVYHRSAEPGESLHVRLGRGLHQQQQDPPGHAVLAAQRPDPPLLHGQAGGRHCVQV